MFSCIQLGGYMPFALGLAVNSASLRYDPHPPKTMADFPIGLVRIYTCMYEYSQVLPKISPIHT